LLIRLALLALVIYLVYRFFWRKRTGKPIQGGPREGVREDVLVQDPWCRTFVPKGQALEVHSQGKTLHFCGAECRDRFLEKERGEAR